MCVIIVRLIPFFSPMHRTVSPQCLRSLFGTEVDCRMLHPPPLMMKPPTPPPNCPPPRPGCAPPPPTKRRADPPPLAPTSPVPPTTLSSNLRGVGADDVAFPVVLGVGVVRGIQGIVAGARPGGERRDQRSNPSHQGVWRII